MNNWLILNFKILIRIIINKVKFQYINFKIVKIKNKYNFKLNLKYKETIKVNKFLYKMINLKMKIKKIIKYIL